MAAIQTQNIEETEKQPQNDTNLEAGFPDESMATESATDLPEISDKPSENGGVKRVREEEEDDEEKGDAKKRNLETYMEEEASNVEEVRKDEIDPTAGKVGPKIFCSSVEMFEYFHKLLHEWPTNLDINDYEHMSLIDLLKKGHTDADKKIGGGIQAFQVRYHPTWKSRCFFLLRIDGSVDDFSFRKCVDQILPLPDNMKVPSASSNGKKAWGQQKGGGGGGSHGRGGRGGRGRGHRGR